MLDTLIGWLSKPSWTPPTGPFVAGYKSPDHGRTEIHNRNGILWANAEIPPIRHDCYVQTYAWLNWFTMVERCACGGMRYDRNKHNDPPWLDRNSRTEGEK